MAKDRGEADRQGVSHPPSVSATDRRCNADADCRCCWVRSLVVLLAYMRVNRLYSGIGMGILLRIIRIRWRRGSWVKLVHDCGS